MELDRGITRHHERLASIAELAVDLDLPEPRVPGRLEPLERLAAIQGVVAGRFHPPGARERPEVVHIS
jgi:hypothetical protein